MSRCAEWRLSCDVWQLLGTTVLHCKALSDCYPGLTASVNNIRQYNSCFLYKTWDESRTEVHSLFKLVSHRSSVEVKCESNASTTSKTSASGPEFSVCESNIQWKCGFCWGLRASAAVHWGSDLDDCSDAELHRQYTHRCNPFNWSGDWFSSEYSIKWWITENASHFNWIFGVRFALCNRERRHWRALSRSALPSDLHSASTETI